MSEIVKVCEMVARLGGDVLRRWEGRFEVREKAPADLVTEADLESQATIRSRLAQLRPGDAFVGEEDDGLPADIDMSSQSKQIVWIVDPLDGTTNYAHGLPYYAVSVAATQGGRTLAGVVFNPVTEECFSTSRGNGAFLNGQAIRISQVERLKDALVAASFPPVVERGSREVESLLNVMEHSQSIRRTGSAALNMCYVASGRFDAYWATRTRSWDVAAGWLIVEEAGGIVVGPAGGEFTLALPTPIVAATQSLCDELLTHVRW